MKTYMALDGLRWSRDSGSANCDIPRSAVFGRPGGRVDSNHRTHLLIRWHSLLFYILQYSLSSLDKQSNVLLLFRVSESCLEDYTPFDLTR